MLDITSNLSLADAICLARAFAFEAGSLWPAWRNQPANNPVGDALTHLAIYFAAFPTIRQTRTFHLGKGPRYGFRLWAGRHCRG